MEVDSPISSLLPELLSEIFIFTVSPSPSEFIDPRDTYPLLRTALLLASVSRTWRTVAHSTPSLWSSLGLESKYLSLRPNVYRVYPRVELVEKWMERCGACPLDLTTRSKNHPRTSREIDGEGEERVVELLRRHHGRIRSLRIVCAPSAKLGFRLLDALIGVGETMPKLEVLEVEVLDESPPGPLILKIPYSSRLSELFLDLGTDMSIDIIFPSKPFDRLRSLTIETLPSLDTDRVLDMLEACSNTLNSFSWNTIDLSPPSSTHQKHVTLPALSSLRKITHSDPSRFFSLLTLPSLTSLHIVVYQECELPLAFHPGLLSRSLSPTTGKTRLNEIHIETNPHIPLQEVLEILRVSPVLKTFSFTIPLTEELALALVADSEPPPSNSSARSPFTDSTATTLAPQLHHMEFNPFWDYVLPVDAFAKMVLSRWGGPSGRYPGKGRLRSVRVDFVQADDVGVMHANAALRGCIEEGFELDLVSL